MPSYRGSYFTAPCYKALIGQEVPWYRGSNLVKRYLGKEALIGQKVPWCRGPDWSGGTLVQRLLLVRRYFGTEALIDQEVPWHRGSNW
jgi:hypothetical protein